MSEREFWIDCIRDAVLDLEYDPDEYDSDEELLHDLLDDIDSIMDRLDLDVYSDGREVLVECLKEYQSIELCYHAINEDRCAMELIIDYLLPEVANRMCNNDE